MNRRPAALLLIVALAVIINLLSATPATAYERSGLDCTYRPYVDGYSSGTWVPVGSADKWRTVDEYPANDNDYFRGDGDNSESDYQLFNKEGVTWMPPDYVSADVTVYYRARDNLWALFADNNIQAALQISGVRYHAGSHNPPSATAAGEGDFAQYSYTWGLNPATGLEWAWTDLMWDLEQFGVYSNDLQPSIRVSAVWMVITFTISTPFVNLSSATAHMSESYSGGMGIGVMLDKASASTVTVNYTITPGTATPGVDYTAPSSGTVTIPPGETLGSIGGIYHLDDIQHEGPETLIITLTGATNAYLGTVASTTWTIDDDDPDAYLGIGAVQMNEGNSGTTAATLTVSLWSESGTITWPVSVHWSTANGTAIGGGPTPDYVPAWGDLTFNPGETSKTVNILVNGDTIYEPEYEYFWVNLSNPMGATLYYYNPGGVRIDNDDSPPVINEFVADHTGSDTHEFVEIYGPPATNYHDYSILVIENDPGENPGVIDRIYPAGTTNASGFWTTGYLNEQLENGSSILLLVEGFTGTLGQDLDANNDRYPEVQPWRLFADAVMVFNPAPTGDYFYHWAPVLDAGGASRIPNGTGSWTMNDFDGAGLPGYTGTYSPTEALNTPGTTNAMMVAPGIPPAVLTNPANQAITYGQNASFTSTASGTPAPTVHWEVNSGSGFVDVANGGVYSGATTTTLSLANPPVSYSGRQYRAVFNNSSGSATSAAATLTVSKATATVTLGNMAQTYNGSALSPTATTSPGGLALVWTGVPQTNAGSYLVTATVNDVNYQGSASGTFVIQKATASITVTPYHVTYDRTEHIAAGTATGVGGVDLSANLDLYGTSHFDAGDYPSDTWSFYGGANYNDASGTVHNKIDPADANITWMSGWEGTYDGLPHGITAGPVTGVGGEDLSGYLDLGATFINVPGGVANWSFNVPNYVPLGGSMQIAISQADANVFVDGWAGTYDGTPHGASGTATGVAGEDLSAGLYLGESFFNVPGGTAYWTFEGGSNYLDQSGIASIYIEPMTATIALDAASLSQPYDGTPREVMANTSPPGLAYSVTYDGSATAPTNAGTYAVTATVADPNCMPVSASGNLVIGKATASVILDGLNQTYSGSPLGPSATTSPAGLALIWTGVPQTNAGSYPVTAAVNDVNYQGSASGTFVINPADANVVVTGWTGTYDGAPHGASGTATGAGGANLAASLDLGATFTDVPGGTAHWSFNNSNYVAESGSVPIAINPADANVTVSGWTGTYDGLSHRAAGTATGVGGADLGASLDLGASFTDAPGGTANWTFSNPNYIDESGSVSIVINKADASVSVNGWTGTYDGAAHGAAGNATGVGGVDVSAGLDLGTSFIDVPGGTASWSFNGGTNYENESGTVDIVINPADADVVVVGWTGTYDATPHGASGWAMGAGGEIGGLDLGGSFVDVPGGTAYWTFNHPNYVSESGSVEIVIQRADADVIVSGWAGTYDGAAHRATGKATGVGGADLSTGLDLGATFTDVPGGTAHWTFTGGTNYLDESGDVNITINKADATVTVNGWTGTYDASAHGATGTATGVGGADLSVGLDLGVTFTDVPGGTANWTFTGGINYLDESGSVAIVINKAVLTVTAENKTSQYSDPRLPLTYTITGFAGGQTLATSGVSGAPALSVALSDPVTEQPGNYTITAATGTLAANNYSFTFANGIYTVTRENAALAFTSNPVSVKVHEDGGDSSAFSIQVTITQAADGHTGDPGKISAADISLSFKPVGGGTGYSQTAASFDPATGIAVFAIPESALPVETYSMESTLTNMWFAANPAEDVLVVYDPSLGFTTGGGWFYWPQDGSALAGAKTNFGYTMKYNNKATNIQGSLLIIAHLADDSIHRIKSNALYGLALNTQAGVGTFGGKCTYTYPVPGSDPVTVGGQEFMVHVQDNNNPGDGVDTFWFTVAGQPFTLDADGDKKADGGEIQQIDGGNIVVPHTPSTGGGGKK